MSFVRITPLLLLVAVAGAPLTDAGGKRFRAHKAAPLAYVDINPKSATHGETVSLASVYRGEGALVQFLASWCGICREEIPTLLSLADETDARLVFVAADEGPAGRDNILVIAARHGVEAPILYVPEEEEAAVADKYPYKVLPATYVIDEKGRIRDHRQGRLEEGWLKSWLRSIGARSS